MPHRVALGCALEGVPLGIWYSGPRGNPGVEDPLLGENLYVGCPNGWGRVPFVGRTLNSEGEFFLVQSLTGVAVMRGGYALWDGVPLSVRLCQIRLGWVGLGYGMLGFVLLGWV
jgi:hypothetical protein